MPSALSAHLLAIFGRTGIDSATVVFIGTLFGPAQVAARVTELAFGRNIHPLIIARASVATMGGDVPLVTAGALLHDIGKVQAYRVELTGFDYTPAGHLLGHVVLGSLLLQERLHTLPAGTLSADQRLELHHFIQSHHGVLEYGAAVRPMTLEAELLHFADQASAKGNDFTDAVEDPELFPEGAGAFSAKRSWRLERRVWRGGSDWS